MEFISIPNEIIGHIYFLYQKGDKADCFTSPPCIYAVAIIRKFRAIAPCL